MFGEKHPKTAASLNSLGMLLKAMSDLAETRLYLEKALAIREYMLGDQHPDTITSLNNLHMLLKEMGGMTDMPSSQGVQALEILKENSLSHGVTHEKTQKNAALS